MTFESIEKLLSGRFITRYNLHYRTVDQVEKSYEIISRNPNLQTEHDIHGGDQVDAVVLILEDETHEHILIDREFRLAADRWVYNFPAGLIDPGETPEEAAARELREETGLELVSIDDVIAPSYSAIGFCNERNICIVGTARGTFHKSTSTLEEIEPGWYTRAEVRELLKTEPFAGRTQAYCYLWSKEVE